MNKFFKNFDWSFKSIAKILGVLLLGVIVVSIVISLFSFSINTLLRPSQQYNDYGMGGGYEESFLASDSMGMKGKRIALPPGFNNQYSLGDDAENFEIKEYSATVRTRKLKQSCEGIASLKVGADVIFETSDEGERSCYYQFKVKKDKEQEVLDIIKSLKPETFNTKIETIQRILDEYDSELEILEKKLASVEDTLTKAQDAYDELTKLATRKQDIESLTKIIDSKLNLIEKLTRERIDIKEQIDRFNKNKSDQLQRLNFSYFNINIYEDLIVDVKEIKDSWKYEIKNFVRNINQVAQDLSVNLLNFIVRFIQVAIYIFISLILLKGIWVVVKKIWKK
ncbi:hypothetical protein HON22_03320 [Candidatus Peregrinibacteria bacterium]|jgi:hypothetical protein|nr:hypothetical protein [Candidatus Peregrinibacteria bacterium]